MNDEGYSTLPTLILKALTHVTKMGKSSPFIFSYFRNSHVSSKSRKYPQEVCYVLGSPIVDLQTQETDLPATSTNFSV